MPYIWRRLPHGRALRWLADTLYDGQTTVQANIAEQHDGQQQMQQMQAQGSHLSFLRELNFLSSLGILLRLASEFLIWMTCTSVECQLLRASKRTCAIS